MDKKSTYVWDPECYDLSDYVLKYSYTISWCLDGWDMCISRSRWKISLEASNGALSIEQMVSIQTHVRSLKVKWYFIVKYIQNNNSTNSTIWLWNISYIKEGTQAKGIWEAPEANIWAEKGWKLGAEKDSQWRTS